MARNSEYGTDYRFNPTPQRVTYAALAPQQAQQQAAAQQPVEYVQPFSYQTPKFKGSKKPKTKIPNVPSFYVPPYLQPTAEDVFADPSYQFRFNEGMKALERSKSAQGTLRSGNTLNELLRYGQDFASQEYAAANQRAANQYGLNYQASRDMYAPYFAQWQTQADLERDAANQAYAREWQQYVFPIDDRFRREQMLLSYGAPR